MDAYFTPKDIAHFMAGLHLGCPGVVADFTSGDGALLSAARAKWPSSKLIGTDINSSSLRLLRANLKGVKVGRCDFLNHRSRASCGVLKKAIGKVSLILLNPPFSCRGGTRRSVLMAGEAIEVSVAMAFMLTAFEYLESGGRLIAVMPAGCLTSEKDSTAWEALDKFARVETVKTNGNSIFVDCRPATCIVRITKHNGEPVAIDLKTIGLIASSLNASTVELIRGHRPMFSMSVSKNRNKIPLVHSTELSNGKVNMERRFVSARMLDLSGPSVLVPRVGLPRRDKVAVLAESAAISISDCIFALRCKSLEMATLLQMQISREWHQFSNLYGGTGAPYLTTKKLTIWLMEQGYSVAVESIGSRQLRRVVEQAIAEFRSSQKSQGDHINPWCPEGIKSLSKETENRNRIQ
jgi:predicted RNA methylase